MNEELRVGRGAISSVGEWERWWGRGVNGRDGFVRSSEVDADSSSSSRRILFVLELLRRSSQRTKQGRRRCQCCTSSEGGCRGIETLLELGEERRERRWHRPWTFENGCRSLRGRKGRRGSFSS